jgi:hypothetical protein
MAYHPQTEREALNDAERREWKQNVFDASGRPTPTYLDSDNPDHYIKRLMDASRSLVSKDMQEVEVKDLYGSALTHYRQRWLNQQGLRRSGPQIFLRENYDELQNMIRLVANFLSTLDHHLLG